MPWNKAGKSLKSHTPREHVYALLHLLLFILLFSNAGKAQLQPAQNDIVYQTELMFSIPAVPNASAYRFIIYGNSDTLVQSEKVPATLVKGLKFAQPYRWEVKVSLRSGQVVKGPYSFFTAIPTYSDSNLLRFKMIGANTRPGKYQDGIILLDYANVAINRSGQVVWFLNPLQPHYGEFRRLSRPLKLTSNGNFIFTSSSMKGAMECNAKGDLLWKTPDKIAELPDSPLFYHHEIQQVNRDQYLTVSTYHEKRWFPGYDDSVVLETDVVLIFNRQNKALWMWKLGDNISRKDMEDRFRAISKGKDVKMYLGQINSAWLDEKKKELYIGIKDFNNILVVSYPGGKILRSYGDPLSSSPLNAAAGFFKFQHGGIPRENGDMVMFNNNGSDDTGSLSEVLVFTQPGPRGTASKKIMQFSCLIDSLTPGKANRLGYVQPLTNGNLLVCAGYAARLFELNTSGQIVWDCIPQSRPSPGPGIMPPPGTPWTLFQNYRAYFYPGLYPNFFAVQPEFTGKNVSLTICNKGYTDDTYHIYSVSGTGKKIFLLTVKLPAGSTRKVQVTAGFKNEVESVNTGLIRVISR